MSSEHTTIAVDHEFLDRIRSLKRGGQSYQDVLERMMDGYEPGTGESGV